MKLKPKKNAVQTKKIYKHASKKYVYTFLRIAKKSWSHKLKKSWSHYSKKKFHEIDKSVTDTAYVSLAINCTSLIDLGQL